MRSRPAFVAARWASITAVSVAPRQSATTLTCFAPVISWMTSSACERPLAEVVLEADVAERLVRVAVADAEHRVAVLDRPLGEALARREVHHVVLVDPGRAEQDRRLVDRLGRGRVLDQLHQPVAVDDLARGRREVLAELELRRVDLARPAAVVDDVVDEVRQPADDARAAGLERPLERGRVARAGSSSARARRPAARPRTPPCRRARRRSPPAASSFIVRAQSR